MKCYKCGKEMSVGDSSYIGICFQIGMPKEKDVVMESGEIGFEDPFDLQFIKKQLGKHFEVVTSKEGMTFCFECRIDSMLGEK